MEKSSYSVHHKSHIGNVMAHCAVGYLLEVEVENGGQGFLIALHRCQAPRIPLRNVYYSSRDPVTGKIVYKGNAIKYHVGVPYNIDCNITNPAFPLNPCGNTAYCLLLRKWLPWVDPVKVHKLSSRRTTWDPTQRVTTPHGCCANSRSVDGSLSFKLLKV